MSNHDDRPAGPRRLGPWIIGGLLATVGVGVFFLSRTPGVSLGSRPVPGSLELDLRAGDVLRFHADTDVLFRNFARNAKPSGCVLQVTLVREGRTLASASCDLYSSGDGASVSGSTTYGTDDATGLRRLQVGGQRVECQLVAPSSGVATLALASNLTACVPRAIAASAEVFRERAAQ